VALFLFPQTLGVQLKTLGTGFIFKSLNKSFKTENTHTASNLAAVIAVMGRDYVSVELGL
jgi:hypothetical protein